jgi:50S ribosomal protein L16 3-hydroxylase
MRSALAESCFVLTPDELAGLACEPELESRILIEHDASSWELRHGPFSDADFAALPPSHWTLLVQDVDKYLPEVADLIDAFDFVPGWRIDDIMVSFAADRGGVGPHRDAYDVFLMQAQGRRRWRMSFRDYTDDDLLPDLDLRILARFETDEDWVLEAGDILYLPPGVAHWGIADGECMTYSLGFRSPSQQELAADWFQQLVSLAGARRLDDPADLKPDSLGELTSGMYANAARLFRDLPTAMSDDFRRWLGRFLTEPKPQFQVPPPDAPWTVDQLRARMAQGGRLRRHPFARIAWTILDRRTLVLFFQGECLDLPAALRTTVKHIVEHRRFGATEGNALLLESADALALVLKLVNEGILEVDEKTL